MTDRFWRIGADAGGDGTTDTDSSGDNTHAYQTFSALEAAEQADLTSASTLNAITTVGGVDTAVWNIDGWTTTTTNFLNIEARGAARFDGVSRDNNSSGYQLALTSAFGWILREDHIVITAIEYKNSNVSMMIHDGVGASDGFLTIDSCGTLYTGTASSNAIWNTSRTNADYTFVNYLAVGDCSGIQPRDAGAGTTFNFNHCGFFCTNTFGILLEDESTVTNSWVVEATNDFFDGVPAPSGSHNASLDGTAQTIFTNSVDIVASANEFTSPSTTTSSFDFTLLDSLLNAAGTGSLAIDITGATRTGVADIGPFNFTAVAPGGRIMSSLAHHGGLVGPGGIAGGSGGLAG